MTYLEKVMRAVKVDRKLLTEEHAQLLEADIQSAIIENTCPGRFFSSAPRAGRRACKISCEDCWNQEAK